VRRENVATLLALGLLVLAVGGCAGNEQASEDNSKNQDTTEETQAKGSNAENTSGKAGGRRATLELQGDSGTEFSGSCTIGDQESEEISGEVPASFTYKLKGKPLDCEISSDGDLQVDLSVGKSVHSAQRISGGTLNLTYKNGSISSSVSSSSGTSSQQSSSSEESDTANESSNVTSESRDVSDFSEVELNGIGNLSIQQTGSESLTVEAEEDVLPKLKTEVENNRLIIGPESNTSIHTNKPINYTLTVKDLNALKLAGSGHIEAEDIDTDELAVTINGAGDAKMAGRADSQDIDISGSGDYEASDLESKDVNINVRGSGSAVVNASDELDAKVSGSGSVEYIGDPTVNEDVSGSGRVREH
jgi:hypothetical protein